MKLIQKYLSLIKFSHTIFAMPFAMIGFFLGVAYLHINNSTKDDFKSNGIILSISLVILCMIFARSAAMAFNRYLDHAIDAKNPRTAVREIPSGKINPLHALYFTRACCLLFIITCYFINPICFYLSFIALFIVLFYSYTKRFTPLCHLVLGIGLSLAPIGAFLAVTGIFKMMPVLFSVIVFCWVSGFDIIYALQDEDFDKENNLFSIPALLGKKKALLISTILHLITAIVVVYIGYYGEFKMYYWIGATIFISMLFYQHSIVSPDDLSRVNIAFMTANGIASLAFSIFVITDILSHQIF